MLPNWLYGKSLKKLQEILNSGGQTAAGVSYSNTESGLEATSAQAAIDEVVEELDTKAAQSALTTLSDTVTTLTGTVNGKVDWSDYAQTGAVNLLPITATSQVINDVTITVTDDGTITAVGTASGDFSLNINGQNNGTTDVAHLPAGDYKFSIDGSGLSENKFVQILGNDSNGDTAINNVINNDNDRSHTITVAEGDYIYWTRLRILSGEVVNMTLKIMLTAPSYTGGYVPPAKTNAELTTDISDLFKIVTYTDLSSVTLTEIVAPLHVGYYTFTPPSGYTTVAISQLYNNGAFILGSFDTDTRVRILSQNPIMDTNSTLKILFKKDL